MAPAAASRSTSWTAPLGTIARRAPSGQSDVQWLYEYDEGVDPEDPFVRAAAETALAAAQADVGAL